MRYIIAATAFALVAGIALGLVVRDTVFEAEAAKPPPTGRLIELGAIDAPGDNPIVQFPLVDVRDCSQVSAMAERAEGGGITIRDLRVSTDGTNLFATDFLVNVGSAALLGSWPFVQFKAQSGGGSTTITAWIWCAP